MTGRGQMGGLEIYHRWGGRNRFWGRVSWYVFPSPEFSTPFCCSLTNIVLSDSLSVYVVCVCGFEKAVAVSGIFFGIPRRNLREYSSCGPKCAKSSVFLGIVNGFQEGVLRNGW